jgi:hypothetical protein
MGEAGYFAMFLAVGAAWVALLTGPVGHAIARRIAGKRAEPGPGTTGLSTGEMAAERIAEVEARLAELESRQDRLLELEERLDFAERLLTGGRAVADPMKDHDLVTPH